MSRLNGYLKDFERMADDIGMTYFPIEFEIVPQDVMLEVVTYALPSRARHWVYGQSYDYQKHSDGMGYSKIYEVVMNNDPAYAFMLDSNSDVINTMVMAHVIGHSHFFKNNYLFEPTDRKMVYHAAERAQRIEEYVGKYGIDKVEHIMNIAFALEKQIDWSKGENRERYGVRRKEVRDSKKLEFDDILNPKKASRIEIIHNADFPPHPESDLLWFLANYAPLEDWERDIFEIIRQESFYFYAQYGTKTGNEGCASYYHSLFMSQLDNLPQEEYMDFCRVHEKVVQPGGSPLNINPYFMGFTILQDIKKRWNDYKSAGESCISGQEKVFQVCADESDVSLIKNYLTQDLVDEMKLFSYRTERDRNGDTTMTIESRNVDDVAEYLTKDMHNYRSPVITIERASSHGMELRHHSTDAKTLDVRNLSKVMGYIHELWNAPINVETIDDNGNTVHHTFDEDGFSGDE